MKYKAIISDVDGTLVQQGSIFNLHGLPSKKVTSAISKIKDEIHFGVATSRPVEGVNYLFQHLSLNGPAILSGGSIIINSLTSEILWEKTLSLQSALEVMRIVEKHNIDYDLNEKSGKKIRSKKGYKPVSPRNIFISELSEDSLRIVHEDLKQIPDIAIHRTSSWNSSLWALDVTHREATKQHGVVEVAKMLHITPSEIIGIGDGYNDFPLLMACGLKIAMGNAVEDLKAIADYIAPSVKEDGLAHVIDKFILSS